ncbi:MAG: NtaA/DmoA family FMN-dependent monooxygenase [Microbacterium sp.]|uniref:NtaA/DmoA family FMN-dependent monooxygenase n=1 Tax=Microbacterium sp. TaxID=51671 RepID=UPI00260CD0E1|nr:NtaA/DmoA family FMN-dependent monooxygenase [Microbacterium sp.]MCX6501696.1 NtaA/DmoA family FMN-dependent monooxygenase [Microbacterium sp.]
MSAPLHFGVFEVFAPQVGGTYSWAHPANDAVDFLDRHRWVRMAKVMDRTGYDFLFFADSYGYPMVNGDIAEMSVRAAINFPALDPATIIPILAHETERLGFVVTASTGIDHPVQLARKYATLDHVTGGRIGWNIVTGSSQNAVAALFGHDEMVAHDDRYEMAQEYVELARAFWEDSWDDDALLADAESGVYIHPERLRAVDFDGIHYRSHGHFTVPPSPQRTPVLFQAGTSPKGKALAAATAEGVFIQATTPEFTAKNAADIRRLAAEAGRDPQSIRIIAGLTAVVAETDEAAQALFDEFYAMQSDELVASLYAGNTGINLLDLDPDGTIEQAFERGGPVGQMGTSNIERFREGAGRPAPTVREILDELRGRGTRGFRLIGSAQTVADGIAELAEQTGVDGFMLEPIFGTRDVQAFGEQVLPLLRERGLAADPVGQTLREHISGEAGHTRLG